LKLRAPQGRLEVPMPDGEWLVSGIVIRNAQGEPPESVPLEPRRLPRPQFQHVMPTFANPGEALKLSLEIAKAAHISRVRLYYRPLDQLSRFKAVEHGPGETFVIPGEDITAEYDLMYYFEVLNDAGSGWFVLDPVMQTPYCVVRTANWEKPQAKENRRQLRSANSNHPVVYASEKREQASSKPQSLTAFRFAPD
jgi:hypothetical protein